MRSPLFLLVALGALLAGCAPQEAKSPDAPAASASASADRGGGGPNAKGPNAEAPTKRQLLTATEIHDDVPAAVAKAKAEGKAVLVDAWAPWCHTCLSMQNYVLNDPSLAPLGDQVVLVAIDTDRPENAAFLEKHAVSVWPTFFVIDPAKDEVLGYWPGSASAKEMRDFIDESARSLSARAAPGGPAAGAAAALAEAKAADAARDTDRALKAYERAVKEAPAGWPRRSEALLGWLGALYHGKDYEGCARLGKAQIESVEGAAVPADFASWLMACAEHLPPGPDADAALNAAIGRLRKVTKSPPADASADDRADALALLAEGLKSKGDIDGAKAANEARLAVLEEAAKKAPTPEIAATFDYARAGAYMALGRPDDAVAMLTAREREMPGSYEPPARLASVLSKAGRLPEALAAVDRAIAKAYGPRKLGYLKLKAEIQGKLGDSAGEIATLREEVAGHEALAKGQADKDRLADAKRRLEDAEKRAQKPRGMLLVPAGPFKMGADEQGEPDERPAHAVNLPAFYLDENEVTNVEYQACVDAGACERPDPRSADKNGFGPDKRFRGARQPVSSIPWASARAYCERLGKRLPTEAEWEKAARGDDGRTYPWGEGAPTADRAVFHGTVTQDVGTHPAGDGPYGHHDLAGNVWEWMEDVYDPYAYRRPGAATGAVASCDEALAALSELRRLKKEGFTGTNPIPTECEHVLRGGAFNYTSKGLRSSNRVHHPGRFHLVMSGFRCAKSA